MKIVCASSMPFAREAFGMLGDVTVLDGRSISAADVSQADVLAIRSTTKVDRELLAGSQVKFVGTATIGTDHMDLPYLEEKGIRWCYAPGCNATSVSEYVTAALLLLARRHGFTLSGKTIGVIGVGNVGGRVIMKMSALGMVIMANDPPRQRSEGDRISIQTDSDRIWTDLRFVDLDTLLGTADVVSLHIPLTREGRDRTFHMVDDRFFERLKKGCIFINSARGAIVDTDSLIKSLESGRVSQAVIDTWENEPAYSVRLSELVELGTPHIAGYSFDGKVKGTEMVYREVCRFLDRKPRWRSDDALATNADVELTVDAEGREEEEVLADMVGAAYDIAADDGLLRQTLGRSTESRAGEFDRLRRQYPVRREFPFTRVRLSNAPDGLRAKAASLGFTL